MKISHLAIVIVSVIVVGGTEIVFAVDDQCCNTGPPILTKVYGPPLKQIRSGIAVNDVNCDLNFVLVMRAEDGLPACIKPEHLGFLLVRGWASPNVLPTDFACDEKCSTSLLYDYGYICRGIGGQNSCFLKSKYFESASSTINKTNTGLKSIVVIPYGSEDPSSGKNVEPQIIKVVIGINNTVRWINNNDVMQTLVADNYDDPLFAAATNEAGIDFNHNYLDDHKLGNEILPGQSFEFTFTKPGQFGYHGEPHPWVKGQVIVLASTSNQSLGATKVPASFEICDTPYEFKQGFIPVLYIPTNSIGKICVSYSNPNNPKVANLMIFNSSNLAEKSIITWAEPDTIPVGNSTVTYSIKTGNHTGFYGLIVFCSGMPFAVGYDNQSSITVDNFPWIKPHAMNCPMLDYQFKVVGLKDIGIKYIPYSYTIIWN